MSCRKLSHGFIAAALAMLFLVGCGTTVKPTPIVIVVTATPQLASTPSAPTAVPSTPSAPTAVSSTPTPWPTPAPATFVVTTKTGTEVRLTDLHLESSSYALDDRPDGIPIESGVEVDFDYISQVEFGDWADGWPVAITLLDGTVLRDKIGWKGTQYTLAIHGSFSLGDVARNLIEIKRIVVEVSSAPNTVPQVPPSGLIATIVYTDGNSIQASNLRFRYVCASNMMCCYGDDVYHLPALDGIQIDFSKIKEVEFEHEMKQDNRLPMRITALDGNEMTFQTTPGSPCESTNWRLIGDAALGFLDIQIPAVRKIVFAN